MLCVWLLLRAWPKINAATRYIVWSATLAAALVVPIATTLAVLYARRRPIATTHAAAYRRRARVTPVLLGARNCATRRAMRSYRGSTARSCAGIPVCPDARDVTIPVPVAFGVFALWLVLAGYALVRLAIGLLRLEQLKRDALPLPVEYRDAMPQWLRANKGARDVRLCVSDETDVPVAVGLFDAMILIPHSLLDRLSEPEVDQICLHELAHLRRADDWTNGLQRLISALLGWNPAAQFIGQQLDLEREVACDDWVLSFVGTVRPYALCLTKMAETASVAAPSDPGAGRLCDAQTHIAAHRTSARRGPQHRDESRRRAGRSGSRHRRRDRGGDRGRRAFGRRADSSPRPQVAARAATAGAGRRRRRLPHRSRRGEVSPRRRH